MKLFRYFYIFILFVSFSNSSFAQQHQDTIKVRQYRNHTEIITPSNQLYIHQKDTLQFSRSNILYNLKNVPSDMWQIAQSPFNKKSIIPLSAIAISTGILIWQDQNILDGVRKLSDNIGLNPHTEYVDLIKIGNVKVYRAPANLNTALYQIGQGGTSMLFAGGMWIYGKIANDKRAISTACDLSETFVTMGLTTQILKRISGRESPFERTQPGGQWRPFPSFAAYQQHTSKYDGFPSGHLATLVATITVLANNYPEKKWIVPVGCAIAAGCAFAMMNTEVHWAGDYPLAIAVGFLSGKITTWKHRKHQTRKQYIPF